MLSNLENYFEINTIYLWINFGVLPFWLMLIFIPNNPITKILINSIVLPLILSCTYIYIVYQLFLHENSFVDNLYVIFSNELFLLAFWLHFLSINLFVGSWLSRDAIKYGMPIFLSGIFLILLYFTGPVAVALYWVIRIFYAKRMTYYD